MTPRDIVYRQAHFADDNGPVIVGCAIFFIVFSTIIVGLRFLSRFLRKLPLGIDDYFTVPALVAVIVLCLLNILSVKYSVGKHEVAVDPATVYMALKLGFFISLTYAWVHFFVKWSILLLYRRIFGMQKRWFRIAFWTIGLYVTCWAFSLVVMELTQCRPLNYFWLQASPAASKSLIKGKCTVAIDPSRQSTSALNSVADFALLIVPAIALGSLQIDLKRKIALIPIFLIGSLACAAGLVRFTAAMHVGSHGTGDATDITWFLRATSNWTAIEAGIGLVCACFPVIAPLLRAKGFQQHYAGIKEKFERYQTRGNNVGWFDIRNNGRNSRSSQDSEVTLNEQLPIYSNTPNYMSDQKVTMGVMTFPSPVRIRDSYQERREILHPGLGDPRVVNEVYRGVAPENMGLDRHGKPLPMTGIKVKTTIACVRSPAVQPRLEDARFEMSHSDHDIWGLDSAKSV